LAAALLLIFFSAPRNFFSAVISKTFISLLPERAEIQQTKEALALSYTITALKEKNRQWEMMLGIKQDNFIPAEVRFGGGYIFSDVLVLSSGEEAGIKAGKKVISKENFLVGEVTEVGQGFAKVMPVGSLGKKIVLRGKSLMAQEAEEIVFEGLGLGGGEIISKIPNSTNLKVGDAVWSGESPQYLVGLIENLKASQNENLSDVTIISSLNYRRLKEVLITAND